MMQNNESGQQLRDLRQAFASQLPERINEILGLWQRFQNDNDFELVNHLLEVSHKLAGSSLSLGYTRIGISAQVIETSLKELIARKNLNKEDLAKYYQTVTDRLNIIQQASLKDKTDKDTAPLYAEASLKENRPARVIYLIEDDLIQADELAHQIGYFGYVVKHFKQLSEAEKGILEEKPDAILMDIVFPEGNMTAMTGLDMIATLQNKLLQKIPVIFMSVRDDINIRLKAARVGGKAYFSKPVNIGLLVDVLDRLMAVEEVLPYRILIVDDDLVQANVNALHLKRAGMETYIVTDPLTIIHALHDFNPDLILLDMYMPHYSGMDLAVVIRQIESFVSVPIVFLSAETDREKQLEAVGMGGDDFLTKPIKPEHLTSAVTSRVDRYRQLRYLMLRDSLTGLLNHTTFKERYLQEFNRATRHDKPLTYTMIDLDFFKKVNDTYGHNAGDRVLKSLASMFSKRLRSSDIIGRYGGEEFAVVLPGTNVEDAVRIFNELRSGFEHIRHRADKGEFTVTFSCGIASFPEFTSPSELAEAADKALYSAKKEGRNRVYTAKI